MKSPPFIAFCLLLWLAPCPSCSEKKGTVYDPIIEEGRVLSLLARATDSAAGRWRQEPCEAMNQVPYGTVAYLLDGKITVIRFLDEPTDTVSAFQRLDTVLFRTVDDSIGKRHMSKNEI